MKWQELDYHPFSLLEFSCFTLWQTDRFIYPQNDPNVATYPLVILTYIAYSFEKSPCLTGKSTTNGHVQ